jgi:uncharacterized protein
MDEHLHTCLLIDFYGQLLTKRQYEILDMYYNNDYSLAEISQILDVSRQAVSDNKRRAYDSLLKYEEMLRLVKKSSETNKNVSEILDLLDKLKYDNIDKETQNRIGSIEGKIKKMVREI